MTGIDDTPVTILAIYSEKDPFEAVGKIMAIVQKHRAVFIGRTSFDDGWDALQENPYISVIVIECNAGNEAQVISFINEVREDFDYEIVVYSDSRDCLRFLVEHGICEQRCALHIDEVVERLPEILGL